MPLSPDVDALRAELAATGRALAAEGLVPGTSGNLSCRAGEHVLITPTGARLDTLDAQDIPLIDLDGTAVDGGRAPTSELALHLGAYGRPGVGAVAHTHAPNATAVSLVADELPCVHYLMAHLGGGVPVARYACFGSRELADAVHDALGDGHHAVLMANHGTLTVGADLAQAAERSRILEWAAGLWLRAAAVATPRTLDAGQIAEAGAALGGYDMARALQDARRGG